MKEKKPNFLCRSLNDDDDEDVVLKNSDGLL